MRRILGWILGLGILALGVIVVVHPAGISLPAGMALPALNIHFVPGLDPGAGLTASSTSPTPGAGTALPAQTVAGAPGTPVSAATALPPAGAQAAATANPPAAPAAPTATLPAPPGTIVQYKVQSGDTLSAIALQYGTTVEAIQERNKISDPNLLFVGAVLQIKVGGTAPVVAAAATVASPAPVTQPGTPTAPPAAPPPVPAGPPAVPASMDTLEPTRPAQAPAAYEVYIPTASKSGQWFHFTCEFDAAWAIFKTYGIDVTLDQQLAIIGVDTSVEPSYKETPQGVEITGGDIANFYSGNYQTNFLARTTGSAMRKVFEHYGLSTTPVHDQAGVEAALRAGELIWIKTTVDFKRWVPATWIAPDGSRYGTVLGNDHAVVIAGFNEKAVLIRDVLGPTSTNANRLEEYEVSWPTFLAAWGAQSYDGLAVARPASGG